MAAEIDSPPIQLAIRHQDAWELLILNDNEQFESILSLPPCEFLRYSNDGHFLISVTTEHRVEIFDTNHETVRCVLQFEHPEVRSACLSPQNSFLLTYSRWNKNSEELREGNLVIWCIENQEPIYRIRVSQKEGFNPELPPIRWSGDEKLCFIKVQQGIKICSGANPNVVLSTIKQRCTDWSVSPGNQYHLALFVPEDKKKQKPGKVFGYIGTERNDQFTFERTCMAGVYSTEDMEFTWSQTGNRVICVGTLGVDNTGKSYYGSQMAWLLDPPNGKGEKIAISVDASLQSVGWLNTGKDEFIVVHDHPFVADCHVCNRNGYREQFSFQKLKYNTVRGSPEGRFVNLCGFGNIQGHMYFFDFHSNDLPVQLGHCQYPSATFYEWAPNGRVFLTSRLFPTRRVENGYSLWDYCGNEVDNREYEQLYQTIFRPAKYGTYRPRAPSVERSGVPEIAQREANGTQKGSYVPPHLRNSNQQKKKKKRRNKPKKQSEDNSQRNKNNNNNNNNNNNKNNVSNVSSGTSTPEPTFVQEPAAPQQPQPQQVEKQIRKINKRIKQIQQLQEKQRSGITLNEDQMRKIQSLTSAQAELEGLQQLQRQREHAV